VADLLQPFAQRFVGIVSVYGRVRELLVQVGDEIFAIIVVVGDDVVRPGEFRGKLNACFTFCHRLATAPGGRRGRPLVGSNVSQPRLVSTSTTRMGVRLSHLVWMGVLVVFVALETRDDPALHAQALAHEATSRRQSIRSARGGLQAKETTPSGLGPASRRESVRSSV